MEGWNGSDTIENEHHTLHSSAAILKKTMFSQGYGSLGMNITQLLQLECISLQQNSIILLYEHISLKCIIAKLIQRQVIDKNVIFPGLFNTGKF